MASASRAPPALELRGVEKTYTEYERQVRALRGVDLTVERGEFVSVIGPSGSGKSTLLHVAGALDHPTAGTVHVDGRDLASLSGAELSAFRGDRLGFIFQDQLLIPRLSALENVCLPARLRGRDGDEVVARARGLLDEVGLAARADHRGVHLSGGEQQRVAIARALMNEPLVVLGDEPTASLDSRASDEILTLLERLHRDRGVTLVLVTHDLREAARARRVVQMRDGAVVADDRNVASVERAW